ncbi:hypothetical protein ACT3R7_20305 [Halomonas sp. AOP43-A1-21]
MLKNQTPEPGVISTCIVCIFVFGAIFLLGVPFMFFVVWLWGDWGLATKYVVPGTTVFAVLASAFFGIVGSSVRKNRFSVLGLAAASLFVYFMFITSFEFSSIEEGNEPAKQLTEEQKARIKLNDECRLIGMQYARAASESFSGVSSRRDVVIPMKCRGLEATQRGIRLGFDR